MVLAVLCGCGSVGRDKAQRFEFRRLVMGVEARVVVYAGDEPTATAGARAAYARLADLEQVFSDYRPGSEVMQLCDRAGQGPIPVSDDLFRVLAAADRVHSLTDGAFDPTVGPLTKLWREARAKHPPALPDAATIEAARAQMGWEHVTLDAKARVVAITTPGVRIDLGGIAKGSSAAEAVRTLRELGLPRAMVTLSGDIAVGEAPPGEQGWTIEIDPGVDGVTPFTQTVRNASVSTSGDRTQFVDVGGVRYSHILDPRTGLGVTHRTAACVIAQDGALADGLATALCVLAQPVHVPDARVWVWTMSPAADQGMRRKSSNSF